MCGGRRVRVPGPKRDGLNDLWRPPPGFSVPRNFPLQLRDPIPFFAAPSRLRNRGPGAVGVVRCVRTAGFLGLQDPNATASTTRGAPRRVWPSLRTFSSRSVATLLLLTELSRQQNRGPGWCGVDVVYVSQGASVGVSPTRDPSGWVSLSLRTLPSSSVATLLFFDRTVSSPEPGTGCGAGGRHVQVPAPLGPQDPSAGVWPSWDAARRISPSLRTFPSNFIPLHVRVHLPFFLTSPSRP